MRLQTNTTFVPQSARLLALVAATFLIASCGQKGELYLPNELAGQVAQQEAPQKETPQKPLLKTQEEKPCEKQGSAPLSTDNQGCEKQ